MQIVLIYEDMYPQDSMKPEIQWTLDKEKVFF